MKLPSISYFAFSSLALSCAVDGLLLRSHTRRLDEVIDLVYFDDSFTVLTASIADLNLDEGLDNSYEFTLYKEWTRKTIIGSSTYKCTNTKTLYEAFCNGHVRLDSDTDNVGTLELQGIVSINADSNQPLAIVGGTAAYMGARGQVVGTKQTAQGGVKNQATFGVWNIIQVSSNDEATTVLPASVSTPTMPTTSNNTINQTKKNTNATQTATVKKSGSQSL